MDWSYFRKEPDGFALKRLPTITTPVRIKDVTELGDYREDFRGASFEKGCGIYQHLFDSPWHYEIEVDTFDEAADRAPGSLLMGMAPFKGYMAEVDGLMGETEPVELDLSEAALKKAISTGLVVGNEDSGYLAGPHLPVELMGLVQRLVSSTHEAIRDFPEAYQEAVWDELVGWDGLPSKLSRMAVGAYGGPIGQKVAQEAQDKADNYVPGSEYGPPHFDPPLELHFRYQGSKDSYPKQRRVAIHHIIGVHQVYLKGRCLDSNEERSYLGHRIEGEILNAQTGELIPVDEDTTSQKLRDLLHARHTTDKPSGVAPRARSSAKASPPSSSAHVALHPGEATKRPGATRSPTPLLRRPGTWGIVFAVIIWWFVLR